MRNLAMRECGHPVRRSLGAVAARGSQVTGPACGWAWVACAVLLVLAMLWASWAGVAVAQGGAGWPEPVLNSVVGGLQSPVHITHAGDGSGRLFVVEQTGRIRIVKGGVLLGTPFLDISDRISCCGERGLLSVTFPPGYASKGHFYVDYTQQSGDTVVARYSVSANPDVANRDSEEVLLTIAQPYANHNGGQLAFGPVDGYLYIGMGDGGSGGDPQNRAQNPGELLGKILRIDVESGIHPYAIPPTNPYTQTVGYRAEIWALGLRNPWRFSFDRQTNDLYIADVGQDRYEEVNFQAASSPGGENYGWRIMEGSHCYSGPTCDQTGLVLPVAEYDHSLGCSVTGGIVYRGHDYPRMQGVYFYGDYCSGRIWGLRRAGTAWQSSVLLTTAFSISTFGEDESGHVYVADYGGDIYLLGDVLATTPTPTPTLLLTPAATRTPLPSPLPGRGIYLPIILKAWRG